MSRTIAVTFLGLIVALPGAVRSQTVTLGTGDLQNSPFFYPAPYGSWYHSSRHQFLVRGGELQAAGLAAGPITTLAFDVAIVYGDPVEGFTLRVGHSTAASLTAWQAGLTTVVLPATFTPGPGWNTHAFATPFVWDGSSGLVFEICSANAAASSNCVVRQSGTAQFVSSRVYRAYNPGACGNAATTYTFNQRPNLRLTGQAPARYQINQPTSSVDFGGVSATPYAPALTRSCIGNSAPLTFAGLPGMPSEAAVGFVPVIPAGSGAFVTPGGQLVNIDFGDPWLVFMNGGLLPAFLPFPGNFTMPLVVNSTYPSRLAIQQVVVTGAMPDGFVLSQAAQLGVGADIPLGVTAGPTGDDSSLVLDVGAVALYGRCYTRISIESNGRLVFGGGDPDYSPTLPSALTGRPFVGHWTDLDPSAGGAVQVLGMPGVLIADYQATPYYGGPSGGPTASFNIQFHAGSGAVVVDGLGGIGPGASYQGAFLGISGGSDVLATDPGARSWTASATGTTINASDMLYAMGVAGTIAPGVTTISFLPNAIGNYDYVCQ